MAVHDGKSVVLHADTRVQRGNVGVYIRYDKMAVHGGIQQVCNGALRAGSEGPLRESMQRAQRACILAFLSVCIRLSGHIHLVCTVLYACTAHHQPFKIIIKTFINIFNYFKKRIAMIIVLLPSCQHKSWKPQGQLKQLIEETVDLNFKKVNFSSISHLNIFKQFDTE